MAQHNNIVKNRVVYDRTDYTALRAFLQGISADAIIRTYYDEYSLEVKGIDDGAGLRRHLDSMRKEVAEGLIDENPALATSVREMLKTGKWSKLAIDYLVRAAEKHKGVPSPRDQVGAWLKPIVAQRLREENIETIADLIAKIQRAGQNWWRSIPRIGAGKAQAIMGFLRTHATNLSFTFTESSGDALEIEPGVELVISEDSKSPLVPLEKMQLPESVLQQRGSNRGTGFCLVASRNDLEAARDYLDRFRDRPHTFRAYRKEIERFMLWSMLKIGKPVSDANASDCTAYLRFLANIPQDWIGYRAQRNTQKWKPFAGQLDSRSIQYAALVLSSWMQWLVNVHYLSANPWSATANPVIEGRISPMDIDRALSPELWSRLTEEDGILDQLCNTPSEALAKRYALRGWMASADIRSQFRLLRAAILLVSMSGLRAEEAAGATRSALRPVGKETKNSLWELEVLGKRNKWRHVYLPTRAVEAIQSHWEDRDEDFSYDHSSSKLISPIFAAHTESSERHHDIRGNGYRGADGFSRMIVTGLKRISKDHVLVLDEEDRHALAHVGTHGLRHTFASVSLQGGVSINVVQALLGHASLNTTTIYVQSARKLSIKEIGQFFEHPQRSQ